MSNKDNPLPGDVDVASPDIAREREAALRGILKVISQSRDDEQPVFDVILKNASRLCHAPMAALGLISQDGKHYEIAAHLGAKPEFIDFIKKNPPELDPERYVAARAMVEMRTERVDDLADPKLYGAKDNVRAQSVAVEGVRSAFYVPLISADRAIGAIFLYRRVVSPFSNDDVALVETFAEQAVIAIENVRQFRDLQVRLEREKVSGEVLEIINKSQTDEMPVFETIVRNAARLCDASLVGLSLVNETRTKLKYTCIHGPGSKHFHLGFEFDLAGPLQIVTTVREARTIHTPDLANDLLYAARDPVRVAIVEEVGVRTFLTVPLVKNGVAFGCINLNRFEVKPFDESEIRLIETFAEQAVIAIENVRQFREVQSRLERERASAEVLGVISQSRDNEMPVFDVILRNAAQLSGAPLANLCLLDDAGSHWQLAAHFGDGLRHLSVGKINKLSDSNLVPAVTMRTASVVHIEDLTDTDLYRQGDPGRVAMVEAEGMRTILGVPLLLEDEAIGCITLFRRDVKAFTRDEIALVETFAAQAVIAIENVRQFREVQERLERERASAKILHAISQNRDDEQPVFDAILSSAARLCDAQAAGLQMLNQTGSHVRLVCNWGNNRGVIEPGWELEIDSPLPLAVAIREARIINISDLKDTDLYQQGHEGRRQLVDGEGVRSWLIVPLQRNGVSYGSMTLSRHEVKPFSPDEIALVETFAAQAVIAIENVRQFREVQTRLEREAATREVLQVISNSRTDDAPVFDVILENAARLCGARLATMTLVNDAGTHLSYVTHWGTPLKIFEPGVTEWPLSSPLIMCQAIREQKIVHVADLAKDELYQSGNQTRVEIVDVEGVRTMLAVPLISQKKAIGCIGLHWNKVKRVTDGEIKLIQTFADQAVIAIENVHQFKALQNRTAEVETLNSGLEERVATQVDELERMGRLKRFLSPQVADAVVSSGDDALLGSHRALIATLFCDIRGFTAFCETAEPEEAIEVLQTYHEAMGALLAEHGAGVDHRAGDGIMAIFNDPLPCDDPTGDALCMAVAMRDRMAELCLGWRRVGHRLGFGVGISLGYATVGMVGSEGRYDYTASGTAVNLAARLCDHANDGEILLSPRAYAATENMVKAETVGELTLKGIQAPIEVFRVIELT